jgi:hypothetical protein
VATLSAVTLWNLPNSELQKVTAPVLEPVVNVAGLDQRWNLFAPNPPRRTYETVARIEYADGGLVLWQPPRNDRWRKWLGAIRSERSRRLWQPTAAWIADHHDSGGRRPVRVELVLRSRELLPPGSNQPEPGWQEEVFYTHDIPGEGRS